MPDPTTDEIDLGQLLWTVLEQWRTLVVGAVGGALLGTAFFFNQPYQVVVEVRPLQPYQIAAFSPLNIYLRDSATKSITFGTPELLDRYIRAEGLTVTEVGLLDEFVSVLQDRTFQASASPILEELIKARPEVSPLTLTQNLRRQFVVLAPNYDDRRNTGSKFSRIEITTRAPDEAVSLLSRWVSESNKRAKAHTVAFYERLANAADLKRQREIVDTKREITQSLANYQLRLGQRLALLKEQADIARTLKIKRATIESVEFSSKNSVVTNVKTDSPLYLRGYEALEREIKLLAERKNDRDFVSELIELEAKLRKAEEDPHPKTIRELVAKTPLTDEAFQVVQLDQITADEMKRKKGLTLIGALGVMGGGFAALLWVFVAQALRRARQSGAAPTV